MLAVTGGVPGTEDERLGPIGWPLGFVVKFGGIPDDLYGLVSIIFHRGVLTYFEHKLWDLYGMRGRAVTGRQEI